MHEYIHLMGDGAHWAFELTGELVTAVLLYPFAKWRVRKHDEKHHA